MCYVRSTAVAISTYLQGANWVSGLLGLGVGIDVEGVASRGALPLAPLDPHFLDPVVLFRGLRKYVCCSGICVNMYAVQGFA